MGRTRAQARFGFARFRGEQSGLFHQAAQGKGAEAHAAAPQHFAAREQTGGPGSAENRMGSIHGDF